jgi:hypothetical protein
MLMMPLPSSLLPIANKLLHLLGSVALSPTQKKSFWLPIAPCVRGQILQRNMQIMHIPFLY